MSFCGWTSVSVNYAVGAPHCYLTWHIVTIRTDSWVPPINSVLFAPWIWAAVEVKGKWKVSASYWSEGWNLVVEARDTCVGAEESFTKRYTVTCVASWNSTGLLLTTMELARLTPKLRGLLQLGKTILQGGRKWTHNWSHRERLAKAALRLLKGAITAEITFVGCFHFVMSLLLIPRLVKWIR